MAYFKIIHKETDQLMCYGKTAEKHINGVCDIFGDEYKAVAVTKEEYERETEEGEDDG